MGLQGIRDAISLCRRWGRLLEAAEFEKERQDFARCIRNSISLVMQRAGIAYLPGCVELADFDPTFTAIAVNLGVTEAVPQEALRATFRKYYDSVRPFFSGQKRRTYTPYEVRNIAALARLGMRQEALQLLRYLVADAVYPPEWNHMAEVVHERRRAPSYIGDMPHTWVGSGYINAVLNLLAYEEGERLVLGAGIDPRWVTESATGVYFEGLHTAFGTISASLQKEGDTILLQFDGAAAPPAGFVIRIPRDWQGYRRVSAERPVGAEIRFDTLPFTCRLVPADASE